VKSLFEKQKVVLVFGKLTFGNREFAEGEIKHFQSSDELGNCQKIIVPSKCLSDNCFSTKRP
jgi:hypothetical protein